MYQQNLASTKSRLRMIIVESINHNLNIPIRTFTKLTGPMSYAITHYSSIVCFCAFSVIKTLTVISLKKVVLQWSIIEIIL